jgi:hypothetical protein
MISLLFPFNMAEMVGSPASVPLYVNREFPLIMVSSQEIMLSLNSENNRKAMA